ncbi:MAG TPA: serine hydrolase [Bryobacteraceae bacterium]|nr:serine hydrolase [Bryobacteraceae bacterium]
MTDRRTFLRGAAIAAFLVQEQGARAGNSIDAPLDRFIESYMREMNSPGMTLSLANRQGTVRVASFGFSDLEAHERVSTDQLFQIGSITKSFVALTLLQLRDEKKLDLHRPILDYLPWLPIETNYGPITAHHLLTHSSGLPNALGFSLTDPAARYMQAHRPGEHFHYCNLGFDLLGRLIAKLDGRPWAESVRKRIFEPLGMTSSSAVISNDTRLRTAKNYMPFFDDRGYPRHGPIAPAGNMLFENAAGSICSTPRDMARYLQMLLRKGEGIVSAESFALFSKPNIEARELSPTARYGYGIGVDQLDGHTILRHTGGMAAFSSSLIVDLDGGVAAFASINAQLGYRPNPVTLYAVQLMNAKSELKAPDLPDPLKVENAADYAGTFESATGRKLEVAAEGQGLTLVVEGKRIPLQHQGGDVFLALSPVWQTFPLEFGREGGKVCELAHGGDWYVNSNYSGPRRFETPVEYQALAGHYCSDSPWHRSTRIAIRKGQLWMDGTTPLEPLGKGLFRIGDEPHGPDTAEFFHFADGKALLLKINGGDLWRIETA